MTLPEKVQKFVCLFVEKWTAALPPAAARTASVRPTPLPRETDSTMPISPAASSDWCPWRRKRQVLMPGVRDGAGDHRNIQHRLQRHLYHKAPPPAMRQRSGAWAAKVMPRHSSSTNNRITPQAPKKKPSPRRR